MYYGVKFTQLRSVALYMIRSHRQIAISSNPVPCVDEDSKLVRRGDFRGITSGKEKIKTHNTDIVLSRIQEHVRKNYRISGDVILFDVVRQLEKGNEPFLDQLTRCPDRWIPLLISTCGHPLSNIENSAKDQILTRLWTQLSEKMSPLPSSAWNARFQVLNENSIEWNPQKEVDAMERSGVEPTLDTFHAVIDKIAADGDVEGCRNMVYNMARKGFAVDAHINAASVFVFSLRGHYKKADSLCEVKEIERHICHRHYYTALSLLEDTKRVSDCLENQRRNTFLFQLVSRLSTQLIRNQEPTHLIRDVTNRVHYAFNSKSNTNRIRMYDSLLYSTLMLKDMDLDLRLQYFRSFVDEIDMKRERIHITLPLLLRLEKTKLQK
uniref:Uncharacterized protein n=1 Tax=Caenorhabditis japonica TaxID=281687 RepID=A0A8R1I5S4_CAEJA